MGSFKVIMMRFLCLFDKPKKKFVLTNRYIIRDQVMRLLKMTANTVALTVEFLMRNTSMLI